MLNTILLTILLHTIDLILSHRHFSRACGHLHAAASSYRMGIQPHRGAFHDIYVMCTSCTFPLDFSESQEDLTVCEAVAVQPGHPLQRYDSIRTAAAAATREGSASNVKLPAAESSLKCFDVDCIRQVSLASWISSWVGSSMLWKQ